ncbi:MAG: UDP-3-O-(3-hydroxymyristoyl)glucosamine N-acyltransferase [bacterium]
MTTIAELAAHVALPYEGDGDLDVSGVRGLATAAPEHLTFVESEKFAQQALASPVRALVAPEGMDLPGKAVIRSPFPQLTVIQITPLLHPRPARQPGTDSRAAVGTGCRIAESATLHPFAALGNGVTVGERSEICSGVSLGDGVQIGADCHLHPGVTVGWGCRLGDRVIVHAGTVFGSDGFGFVQHEGRHVKIPHVGNVIVEDDVEIGANCAIDRSTYDTTVIRRGTKMDNLVHIAHNCDVGEFSLFSGQCGVAGTTKMGAYFLMAGQSGVAGHLDIPDRVTIGPKSMMVRTGRSGETYAGIPARPMREWAKAVGAFYSLPRLMKRWRAAAATGGAPDSEGEKG